MGKVISLLFGQFNLNLGKMSFPVSYAQAALIVFLIFVLILMMAQFRRHYVNWSLKGAVFGIFFGFLLALILEGFLIIGGRTAITGILGWKNAPAPISIALDAGRNKLIQVLGIKDQIPSSFAKENANVAGAVDLLQSLNPADMKKVKTIFCQQ
ncbi:hypothetical protein A2394_00105 [Candidatus Woesebacteria bacterium RIFOXYB1_FULL_42_36]|uniref:Uncharacterized protein n=2 Tax=Candidatus Woeseibacteriota TaxID=1752722 RepID=A0A1F8DIU2_9BACT|nr:MAG: hypothetical protein A2197_01350 [Candidatus Woesebacteria bacterium RIFOXYA1_FULL_48_16]OGM81871.1 MAG: hypothetical protein A2394_00105 [Candidatus Woesebacteria bacterium RIFOXYB1_FULL_42_36]OGM83456.1 MAG: hypothetical protein A2421_00420 [Candidatus Woesebacteria bacterium RIFOXYC1_FULL_43_18]OGM88306.1 MAG: hypothetical protein A2573_02740 [Candidatus Woesebacteria bacterium RIFOXYD1_FULL_43_18]